METRADSVPAATAWLTTTYETLTCTVWSVHLLPSAAFHLTLTPAAGAVKTSGGGTI